MQYFTFESSHPDKKKGSVTFVAGPFCWRKDFLSFQKNYGMHTSQIYRNYLPQKTQESTKGEGIR